ncbi:hypothetical protein AB4Y64_17590 [Lysobacter sp. TAF61]
MTDIKSLVVLHGSHSKAFRALFSSGDVKTNLELIDLLSRECADFPDSAAITIVSWNRGTRPDRVGIGITDDMLDRILVDRWPLKA